MCLVYDARPSTKDVDAIFQPSEIIREAAKEIANEYELVNDWLNDGVKGFLVEHPRKVFLNLSHLVVMVAEPEYMLAMKSLSARIDGTDSKDIEFLINKLKITTVDEVFKIIDKYYPRRIVKPYVEKWEKLANSIYGICR
jgi:adenylate kinase